MKGLPLDFSQAERIAQSQYAYQHPDYDELATSKEELDRLKKEWSQLAVTKAIKAMGEELAKKHRIEVLEVAYCQLELMLQVLEEYIIMEQEYMDLNEITKS